MDGAVPSAEEKSTANRLLDAGIVPTFRPTRDVEMLRTSDVFISDGKTASERDFKNPKGNGSQTIYHQFKEAAGQAHKVVIDLAHSEMDAALALKRPRKSSAIGTPSSADGTRAPRGLTTRRY